MQRILLLIKLGGNSISCELFIVVFENMEKLRPFIGIFVQMFKDSLVNSISLVDYKKSL